MKKIKLLALALALIFVFSAFVACGKKDGDGDDAVPPTFATIVNPNAATLEDVVTELKDIGELDGFTLVQNEGFEYAELFVFEKVDFDKGVKTYKVLSLRTGKIVETFTNTETVEYTVKANYATPTFTVSKQEKVLDENKELKSTRITNELYDATGVSIDTKKGASLDELGMFYDWVVYGRDIYTIDEATGALTKKTSIPKNIDILDEDEGVFNGTNIYVETDEGIAVCDADFNYVTEWFEPVNVANGETIINNDYIHESDYQISWFVLDNGNLLIQYFKKLSSDAVEYDVYKGDTSLDMRKYALVTEIFSITDKTSTNVSFGYYIDNVVSNKMARFNGYEDVVGEFENYAVIYPIQDKKINFNDNVVDIVLLDNNAVIGQSMKLVENQRYIPEKIADNLYLVYTTYGYAFTDVNGKVIKQITNGDWNVVGQYIVDDEGIYDFNFELVYDFDDNNASFIGYLDNTIFVKQYADEDKNDYSVISFPKGEADPICKYVKKDEGKTTEFILLEEAGMYAVYNQETKLYSYYNADGKLLKKGVSAEIKDSNTYGGCIVHYKDKSGETEVDKYMLIVGNRSEDSWY